AAARPAGGLRADYGFVATMDREIKRDPGREVRYGITESWDEIVETLKATMDREIRRDPEREVGYGITDSWDEIVETLHRAPVSTDTELGRHMTAFETRVRQDTDEVYTRWRQRLDCPERLGGDRWMRVTLPAERLCHFALPYRVTALQGQQGPVGGPVQPELPEEAGSSS
ncbi:hypothetical protein Tco_0118367, partial [Tanacetum coccineum]